MRIDEERNAEESSSGKQRTEIHQSKEEKICTRALLDGFIVGSIGYQTFGRALVYLVYRQQANKIEGATPTPPALCHY